MISLKRLVPFCLAMACLAAPQSAKAIYLSENGGNATMLGQMLVGDEKVFAEFLARPRAQPIRVLYLDSYGGSLSAGIGIGLIVRKAGLTTAVNAPYKSCVSACTLIFAAGVRRHYIHGETIEDGYNSASGLGYHTASFVGTSVAAHKGDDIANRFYTAMGSPAAGGLAAKGRGSSVYRPSGATSLSLKIATSLAEP